MNELYGLTKDQFNQVGTLVNNGKKISRPASQERERNQQNMIRVIAETQPSYNPNEPFLCPVFEYFQDANNTAIYLTGSDLQGNVVFTIDGVELDPISVRSTTEELDAHLQGSLPDGYVVNVWLGLWEIDGTGADFVSISVEPEETPEEPPEDFIVFSGGLQTVREPWVSVKIEGEPLKEDVTDAMPYTSGTISAGAIGLCSWHDSAGWIPFAWQCREVEFATEEED